MYVTSLVPFVLRWENLRIFIIISDKHLSNQNQPLTRARLNLKHISLEHEHAIFKISFNDVRIFFFFWL